jgi:hypothetical protein
MRLVEAEVAAVMEERDRRLLSEVAALYNGTFDDTLEYRLLQVLLFAKEPISLAGLAAACGVGRRSILPGGGIRRVLGKLQERGFIVNVGSQAKQRYSTREPSGLFDCFRKLYPSQAPPSAQHPAEVPRPPEGVGGVRG